MQTSASARVCVRVSSQAIERGVLRFHFPASAPLDGPVVERSGGTPGKSSRRGRLEAGGGEGGGGERGAAPQPRLSTRGREPPTCRCAAADGDGEGEGGRRSSAVGDFATPTAGLRPEPGGEGGTPQWQGRARRNC